MDRNASNGHTNVFVNGCHLPFNEWAVWSQMLGYWFQPGRYWLDANGNAGFEGNATPLVNLYAAARQNAYRGNRSGGDNFWSSRFSAGNSNADNSQGYVSVPHLLNRSRSQRSGARPRWRVNDFVYVNANENVNK